MLDEMPLLRREELVALRLRALYEKAGYRLYRMGSFEEYDLYMQNKNFLQSDDIITFKGANGSLMALRPDVTLSIVKNAKPGEAARIYYNENVFRRGGRSGEYREISQMGLEFIGGEGIAAEREVLALAAESLGKIGDATLDLSHMEFIEAMLAGFTRPEARQAALAALRDKSPHAMRDAACAEGLDADMAERLTRLTGVSGPFAAAMETARVLGEDVAGAAAPLDELDALYAALKGSPGAEIRLDFSIINDADYYSGVIFQGFVRGVPRHVLGGGRYDNLMARFGKPQGAVGFALYLDEILRAGETAGDDVAAAGDDYLNVALPKGRLGDKVYKLFAEAGLSCGGMGEDSRKLVFEDEMSRARYFLVKPTDVHIYVERGVADIGVVGKDVLLENGSEVLEILDLRLGRCRLAVAGRPDYSEDPALPLRVATKYPHVARHYYAAQSRDVEVIKLNGSMELAPLVGLSDVIVDIVETGATLKENGLSVLADIAPSSARLIANLAAWRFKGARIKALAEKLEGLV